MLHPGVFDACIHLAPVPRMGEAITVTRVPVAAGSLALPAARHAPACGWTATESVGVAADQSAENNIRWRDGSGGGMQLAGLLAKPVRAGAGSSASAAAAAAPASQLLYSIQWQAHSKASSTGTPAQRAVAPGQAAVWMLRGKRQDHTAVAAPALPGNNAAYAARALELLQRVRVH